MPSSLLSAKPPWFLGICLLIFKARTALSILVVCGTSNLPGYTQHKSRVQTSLLRCSLQRPIQSKVSHWRLFNLTKEKEMIVQFWWWNSKSFLENIIENHTSEEIVPINFTNMGKELSDFFSSRELTEWRHKNRICHREWAVHSSSHEAALK